MKSNPDYAEDVFIGAFFHNEHFYVFKSHFQKHCDLLKDVQDHPVLFFIFKVATFVFALLLFCLGSTYCKYKKIQSQYTSLKSDDTAVIVNQKVSQVEDDGPRPQRRGGKFDKDTFGKRSINESAGDIEMELGKLDIDFT